MKNFLYRVSLLAILLLLNTGSITLRQGSEDSDVDAILAAMSPEEKVGQLFLVTFYGSDIQPGSDIVRLISEYHVGGVVLLRGNNNFSDEENLPLQVQSLNKHLQQAAAGVFTDEPIEGQSDLATATPDEDYIPLFIALDEYGTDTSIPELLSGISPTATNLALGATWDPQFSRLTGEIKGEELSLLGFNMLLGPTVDVVETPQPLTSGNIGTRTFGGEPFWVSKMAVAYVAGVKAGSEGRLAVIPRHFPGYGSADRLATNEIPTVRRSKDQLSQVDLLPFFALTRGQFEEGEVSADGVLVGHIQYQGFGDNIRASTRPMTVDTTALQSLLALEPIASWHASGGLIVSDSLSVRGIRRYYDPQGVLFPGRRIASEAFAAGNDVLYLGNFGANAPASQTQDVTDTIGYFVQRYNEDPGFQERVNQSVRRILQSKMRLYGSFDYGSVDRATAEDLGQLGEHYEETLTVALEALTQLPPTQGEAEISPGQGDNILIFTDSRTAKQCADCEAQPLIPVDAFRSSILRSYGPDATGLVSYSNVDQYAFVELERFLNTGRVDLAVEGEPTPEVDRLALALTRADWIVFLTINVDPAIPSSGVVKRFLSESSFTTSTNIVVMALGAPYYLDSTEIGKLAAYYALYSYSAPYIDVAARALFQEIAVTGAPAVSVPAVDYNVLLATSPDPAQIIHFDYVIEGQAISEPDLTATPTPENGAVAAQGDTLRLSTAQILDRNGNVVPDGTPVEFVLNYVNDGVRDTQPKITVDGRAQASVVLARPGELIITAFSGEAVNSAEISVVVRESGEAVVTVREPEVPTETPLPTNTPDEPATLTPAITPDLDQNGNGFISASKHVRFSDLFLSVLGLIGIASAIFTYGTVKRTFNYGLLLSLPSIIAGLIAYNYYALLLPGSSRWRSLFTRMPFAAGTITWIGALLGLLSILVAIRLYNQWLVSTLGERE